MREEVKTTEVSEDTINIKKMAKKGNKFKGKIEVDVFSKVDVDITTDFPELIKDTHYKMKHAYTYENLDAKSFTRFLEEDEVKKTLRNKYPQYLNDYIFKSKEFEGRYIDFVAEREGVTVDDIIESAGLSEALLKIPSYMKAKAQREPKADPWAS